MAVIGGHQGAFALTGNFSTIAGEIYSFTLSPASPMFESTIFGDTVQRVKAGLTTWRGHAVGFLPSSVQFPVSLITAGRTASTLTLTTQTGKTIASGSGKAVISNIRASVNTQNGAPLNSLEFDFTFNDEPVGA